jgi:NADH-quinone oxidoreductase chain G
MISLTIDDREIEVEDGSTILEAAEAAGVFIPTFCYHKRLMPFGACRMCVVEVEQMKGRLVPSCSTPAANGMVVNTNTPAVRSARKTLLELLLVHHPLDCPVCDKGGECKLQDLVYEYEVSSNRFLDRKFSQPAETASHLIERNVSRCVLCGMCARVCEEMVGVAEISFVNRGFKTRIGTDFDRVLDCEFCGECVNICPVGALTDKLFKYKARSWELARTDTVCSYCSTGCTITLGVKNNRIYRVIGDDSIGANRGSLCAKGRFGYGYVSSPERMNSPLVRKGAEGLVRATWAEAMEKIAEGLGAVKQKYGPDGIGGICSGRLTNEEAYLFQKFLRAAIGTNNIDHAGGYSYSGLMKGLRPALGLTAGTAMLNDIRNADTVFLLRCHLSETHPVVGYQVTMAVKRDERKLVVASERPIKHSRLASCALIHRPETELVLLQGMINIIISEGLYDREFVSSSTAGLENLKHSVARYTPEHCEGVTGVGRDDLVQAARLIAGSKRLCILLSTGLGIPADDEKLGLAVANLALLTGMVKREGCGIAFLGEKCNSQGTLDMGVIPGFLPGFDEVGDDKTRGRFEEAWKVTLPARPGQNAMEMITSSAEGRLHALYLAGENPLLNYPESEYTRKALESLDFLVVQDMFLTPTARQADVVLPVASFAEKRGTYTSFERRVQALSPALPVLEGVKTDLEIFCELSRRMGHAMKTTGPDDVMKEISSLVPLYANISCESLGAGGRLVPSPPAGPRTSYSFVPLEHAEPARGTDGDYPLLLRTGSMLFHSGSLSTHAPALNELGSGGRVEVSPADARAYGLGDAEKVLVTSRMGSLEAKVKISRKQAKGMVYIPCHFAAHPVNRLTSRELVPTWVKLEKM